MLHLLLFEEGPQHFDGRSPIQVHMFAEVDVGILGVFCDNWELTKLDGLINAIDATING